MLSYSTRKEFVDQDHHSAVIRVQTKKTWYLVAVLKEEVVIQSPGLKISQERQEEEDSLTEEAVALLHVIRFEGAM